MADRYIVMSGYDGRVIAEGLSRQERDDLIDRICRRLSDDDLTPHWKMDHATPSEQQL